MDFGIWVDNRTVNKDQMDSQRSSAEQQSQTPSGNGNGGSAGGDGSMFMHQIDHPGVVCDICDISISGFRYKCLQCSDFDLCSHCERKGHHAGHIMLRIAFPEQTGEMQKYLNVGKASTTPGVEQMGPRCGIFGTHGGHGLYHGRHGHHGHKHRHEGRDKGRRDSSPESQEDSKFPAGCPYQFGKHGSMKKWAKCMKKAAHHHRKSAEAYAAQSCGQQATAAGAGEEATPTPNIPPFDFTAAAAQIQEFLNAWGVPIDVVELYDEWGNRGQPSNPSGRQGEQNETRANTEVPPPCTNPDLDRHVRAAASAAAAAAFGRHGQQNEGRPNIEVPPAFNNLEFEAHMRAHAAAAAAAAGAAQAVSEQLQNLNLNVGNAAPAKASEENTPSAPISTSPTVGGSETDGDGDWTVVDADKVVDGTTTATNTNNADVTAPPPLSNVTAKQNHVTFDIPSSNPGSLNSTDSSSSTSGNGNATGTAGNGVRAPSEANNAGSDPTDKSIHSTPRVPSNEPTNIGVPIYPILNQVGNPQFQQMMQGVSNALGSVMRNIPITNVPIGIPRQQHPGTESTPAAAPKSLAPEEMDARSRMTLNQLLSMGFSNVDNWLARLVIAKNGDLDAVLSSLFPGGAPA